ncbi:hypothetical protein [Tunicatimonas pelagia]|uniref:hypothetical protein n=1 Tax=Tunicatimonas pelagia TaxID=931531 RepID=UPI0026659208|nr:hypothetical protein [Tunicatimonas pelagia]WKN44070.1 hypothetical protein P0M28_03695 [Tunicatimonas pelagia]
MKRFTLLILGLFWLLCAQAQVDTTVYTQEYIERSTKFAWLTLGGDLLALPGGSTEYLQEGTLQQTSFGNTFIPRLTIGGIHFWGHADFYVTFPLSFLALQSTPDLFDELSYTHGIETGMRLYPMKLQPKRISPFLGISFRSFTYQHLLNEDEYTEGSPRYSRMITPLQFGATYATDKYLLSASAYYQFRDEIDYYISPTQAGTTTFNPVSFNLSFLRYWDTGESSRSPQAVRNLNHKYHVLKQENRLSAWYWGVGPSAGLQMSKSAYLENQFPFLYDQYSSGFMPDLTFGRFFHKPDMNVGLSFRTLGDRLAGFDTEIRLRRYSFMLETYKNLFNWLGFVPFVGVTGSMESLRANVNGTEYQETKPVLGLIFGWDIRVTKTGTSLLRTNLRWIPDLHLEIEGDKMMFDHLEFNFIQWVQFIGRKKAYEKYKAN